MDNSEAALARVPRDFDSLRSVIIERKAAMPKRLAQVAAYALSNPDDMAFGTAASIAAAADVQPSTLVRLAHHLGYEGFSDLQNVFRARLRDRTLSYEERLLSLEAGASADSDTELLSGFINAASQSLARLAGTIDGRTFSKSVDLLARAETIYLVAKRRSYPLTAHIAYAFPGLSNSDVKLLSMTFFGVVFAKSLDFSRAIMQALAMHVFGHICHFKSISCL